MPKLALREPSAAVAAPWWEVPPSALAESPAQRSDAALVRAVAARDAGAMSDLFARHGDHVRHIVLHILGPSPEVPDLVHDVFVLAFERIDELKTPGALRAWLSGMAVRFARSFIRRRRRWWLWPARRPSTTAPTPRGGPEVSAALRQAYAAVDELPADERIAFVLRMVESMQIDEIAQACATSAPTIKRRIKRAEARLRQSALDRTHLHNWLDP